MRWSHQYRHAETEKNNNHFVLRNCLKRHVLRLNLEGEQQKNTAIIEAMGAYLEMQKRRGYTFQM